jgi:hypothetical protein
VDAQTLEDRMIAHYDSGEWVDVVSLCQRITRLHTGSVTVHSRLFDALCALNRLTEAETSLNRALSLFPDNIELLGKQARLATLKGDYAVAAARWSALQTRFPDVEEFRSMAAFCSSRA